MIDAKHFTMSDPSQEMAAWIFPHCWYICKFCTGDLSTVNLNYKWIPQARYNFVQKGKIETAFADSADMLEIKLKLNN